MVMKRTVVLLFLIGVIVDLWGMEGCKSVLPKHVIDTSPISPRKVSTDKESHQHYVKKHKQGEHPSSPLKLTATRKKKNECTILLTATQCNRKTNHNK